MKNLLLLLICFCVTSTVLAQESGNTTDTLEEGVINGTVLSASTDKVLQNVNIVNLNNVKGATTDDNGYFEIKAAVDDTLYFSYLGYKSLQVRVSADWVKYGDVKIKMTEIGIALEEVVVQEIQLTGYLEIDAKKIPIYNEK